LDGVYGEVEVKSVTTIYSQETGTYTKIKAGMKTEIEDIKI